MLKVIIPTDFSVQSLRAIPAILKKFPDEQLQIILLHIMQVSGNPLDLLMLPRERKYLSLFAEDYRNEIERLRTQANGQIESIYTDFLYMGIQRIFNDYVDRHNVDALVLAEGLQFKMPDECSIDPVPIFAKAKIPVLCPELVTATIKTMPVKEPEDLQAYRYSQAFG